MKSKIKTILALFFLCFISTSINAQKTRSFPKQIITEKSNYYLRIHTLESLKSKKGTTLGINGISITRIRLKKTDFNELSMQEKTLTKLLELVLDNFQAYGIHEPKAIYSSDIGEMGKILTTIAKDEPQAPYSISLFVGAFKKAEKKIKKDQEVTLEDYTSSNFIISSNKEAKNYYINVGVKPLSEVFNQLKKDVSRIK